MYCSHGTVHAALFLLLQVSSSIYSGEGRRGQHPSPLAQPCPPLSSSSVVLSEALPENHELHHHAVVLPEISLYFSSPLLDQEGGDVPGLYVC